MPKNLWNLGIFHHVLSWALSLSVDSPPGHRFYHRNFTSCENSVRIEQIVRIIHTSKSMGTHTIVQIRIVQIIRDGQIRGGGKLSVLCCICTLSLVCAHETSGQFDIFFKCSHLCVFLYLPLPRVLIIEPSYFIQICIGTWPQCNTEEAGHLTPVYLFHIKPRFMLHWHCGTWTLLFICQLSWGPWGLC